MKYKKTTSYKVVSGVDFHYEDEQVCFPIRDNKELNRFLKKNKKLKPYNTSPNSIINAPRESGVYLVCIIDTHTNLRDISYIGCSELISRRLYAHPIIRMHHFALHAKYKVEIYTIPCSNFTITEKELIKLLNPFLNIEFKRKSVPTIIYKAKVQKNKNSVIGDKNYSIIY